MKRLIAGGSLLFFIGTLLCVKSLEAAGKWELIYEKNNIKGYARTFPGTHIREFKATTFIDAKLEVIGCVLRDIESYPQWMADCKETRIIDDSPGNIKIFYYVVDTPWPTRNRDVIIKSSTEFDLNTARVKTSFEAVQEPHVPKKRDRVRMTELTGTYLLEFFGRDKTRVTYSHRANPAGRLPLLLANLKIKYYPYRNLLALKRMVKMEKYLKRAGLSKERALIEAVTKDREQIEKIAKARLNEFIDNERFVEVIFRDKEIVERLLDEGIAYENMKEIITDVFIKLLKNNDVIVHYYINDEKLAKKLIQNKELYEKLAKDEELEELILEHTGTIDEKMSAIEQIIKKRITGWDKKGKK